MSERQAKAPTMSALLPSRLVPEDTLNGWQGPNLPNTKNYAPPPDSLRGRMGDVLMQGIAALGGFTGLPMGGEESKAALLGELLAAGIPLVGGVKKLAKLVGAENKVAQGIKAYHGSPHDFPPVRELMMPDGVRVYQHMNDALPAGAKMIKEHPLGRFDMSKIGTGEGAQAYGHGLYFAESPEVAHGYRTKLSDSAIDTVKADVYDIAGERMWKLKATGPNGTVPVSNQYLRDSELEQWLGRPAAERLIKGGDGTYKDLNIRPGKTYEVNIDADPEDFLDWDAPLSQQSAKDAVFRSIDANLEAFPLRPRGYGVRSLNAKPERKSIAALDLYEGPYGKTPEEALAAYRDSIQLKTGQDAYRSLVQTGGKVGASEALQQAGIPGIKYLDGASRSAGQGSRNYVVFDDTKISIVRKFGIAAALSAGAINELEARQLQAQGYQ